MAEKKREFSQGDRAKLDIRVSEELDKRIEAVATRLGTTKNSVVAVACGLFCAKMERAGAGTKKRPSDAEIEAALRELAA